MLIIIILILLIGDGNTTSALNSPSVPTSSTPVTSASSANKQQSSQATNIAKQFPSSEFTSRQAASASGLMTFLSSIIPGVVNSLMPLAVLFGLGALAVPALGLGILLRSDSRRR